MKKFVLKPSGSTSGSPSLPLKIGAACPAPSISNSAGIFQLYTTDTESINLSGAGTLLDPLRGDIIVSPQPGNGFVVLPDGVYVPGFSDTRLLDGGDVVWTGTGYVFDVAPAVYIIEGAPLNSDATQVELTTSDPVFDRIDLVYVDINGNVGVLTGVAELNPVKPQIDPSTQIELTTITVTAASSVPDFEIDVIYNENEAGEWNGSVSGVTGNFADTTDAQSGSIDTSITTINNNDTITYTKDSGTSSLINKDSLTFYIKLKAVLPAAANLRVSFYNAGVQVTSEVAVLLDKNNTTSYQGISIPLSTFIISNYEVDAIRFRYTNINISTHAGFYLDNIYLQRGLAAPIGGDFIFNQFAVLQPANFRISGIGSAGGFDVSDSSIPTNGMYLPAENQVGFSTNSTNRVNITPTGILHITSTIATLSFWLGSGSNADYYIQRNGTNLIRNSPGAITDTTGGNIIYTYNSTDGHTWNNASGTFQMRIEQNGNALMIGSGTTQLSSLLNINSTTKGVLLPRMTTTQKNAISSPATSLLVFDTTMNEFQWWDGDSWEGFGGGGGGTYTVNNGLTETPAGNFKLGGILDSGTTTLDGYTNDGSLSLGTLGTSFSLLLNNFGTGGVMYGETEGTVAVQLLSKAGKAIHAVSTDAPSELRTNHTSTGVVSPVLQLTRAGGGAVGTGASIDIYLQAQGVSPVLANTIVSKWEDHTIDAWASEISITGFNAGSAETWFTIHSTGQGQLNNFGAGVFEEVPAWVLGVDPSGNLIEIDPADLGGGGGGATNFTDLGDVPSSYTGHAGKGVRVNVGETGLEFYSIGSLSDGDKGDITVSSTGSVWTIDNGVVSNAKLANSSIGFSLGTSGTDVSWSASPVSLGDTATLNIPDASATARGVVTTGTQTLAGNKTFTGFANFAGAVQLGSLLSNSAVGTSNFAILHGATGAANSTSQLLFESASAIGARVAMRGSTNYTIVASSSYAHFIMGEMNVTEASSGTHALIANMVLKPVVVTNAAGATTNMATLYIEGAPSGVTPTGESLSIWVKDGLSRLEDGIALGRTGTTLGQIFLSGSTSGVVTLQPAAVAGTATITLPSVTSTLVGYVTTTTASSAAPAPTGDAKDNYLVLTALATDATFAAPSGTPANLNTLLIRIKDDGTPRNLNWNAIYRAGDISFPTITVAGDTMYITFIYNSADSKWDLVGLTQGI